MATAVPVLLCPACDLPHAASRLPEGAVALCRRCGQVLYRTRRGTLPWSAGLLLAALPLFALANLLPFVALEFGPPGAPQHLLSSALALWRHGEWWLALLLFLLVFLVPLARILAGLWVFVPLLAGRVAPAAGAVFREVETLRPWAMTEVYLLALVVAWAKLRDLATIDFGPGALAFVLVIVLLLAAETVLEPMEVWERIAPQTRVDPTWPPAPGSLLACGYCRQVLPRAFDGRPCPRCHGRVHRRRPGSLPAAWAFLIAACFTYVPANLLPVMNVTWLGRGEADTILSGVKALVAAGQYPVAAVVFFASLVVPVLKIVALAGLLVSIHVRSHRRPRERTVLYRVVDAVGRWSMIDVFMVGILTALVAGGRLAAIEPGPGISAFAATVILTMLAAHAFDPRLIWDAASQARSEAVHERTAPLPA